MTGPKRILVTGSRQWSQTDAAPELIARRRQRVKDALEAALTILCPSTDGFVLVHGAADGLDSLAASVAKEDFSLATEAHPADWRPGGRFDPTAGFTRNQRMVDLGADLCLGFPLHPEHATGKNTSRGTWHCIHRASQAPVPTLVVWMDQMFSANELGRQLLTDSAQRIGDQPRATDDGHLVVDVSRLVIPF